MTRSFLWKVVSLMMLVSAVPLVAGGVIVDQLLKNTIALGLDQRVGDNLDHAIATYRDHIALKKQLMRMHADSLGNRRELVDLLSESPPAPESVRKLLEAECDTFSNDRQGIVRITVDPVDAGEGERAPITVDHRARFAEKKWRAREIRTEVRAADGRRFEMAITYAVPWALFRNYQALGDVRRLFDNLADRQSSLTEAYTRTYYLTATAALLLTLLLAVWLATRTTERLGLLAKATEKVAAGDLQVAIPVRGVDEIAHLTADFNTMVVELREARERLNYLERVSAWQEIARRLAHEIKNPLTPILLAVQQLDRKFDAYTDDPRRYRRLVSDAMEIVGEEVEGLRRLVVEFSEFARLPAADPQPTSVADFVADVVRTNPQFEPYLAELRGGDVETTALIDHTMMRRVLLNLLQNARAAVDEAGDSPGGSVELAVVTDGGRVRVEVTDRGVGVASDALPRLFDPYFTTKSDGTGLGLSIVKKIVLEHRGTIAVESPVRDNGGTRFVVDLPVASDVDSDGHESIEPRNDAPR